MIPEDPLAPLTIRWFQDTGWNERLSDEGLHRRAAGAEKKADMQLANYLLMEGLQNEKNALV